MSLRLSSLDYLGLVASICCADTLTTILLLRDTVRRLLLNAGTEVSLRLSSLDYLGLVASRLRRYSHNNIIVKGHSHEIITECRYGGVAAAELTGLPGHGGI